MRIRYLRLPAFGIFTEQAVGLARAGLHLIYGPNEAGKSTCSLPSVMLCSASPGSPRAQHKPASLRIVMGLQLADGQELAFIRRKGNKNTISDLDGNTLPDDLLASYLAGLRRPEFEDMFGLDHLRLREGGQRLLESGGEFSQSLFEAASGLRHLRETFQELEEKARSLYLPQGQNPAVNQLMSAYKEQRKAAEAVGLSAQAFEELEARYQQEQELAELAAGSRKPARDRPSSSASSALPCSPKALKGAAEALAHCLSARGAQLYQDLTTQLHSAEQQEKTVEGQIRELEAQLAELDIPEELLAQGETVADLFSGLGKYREWVDALPQVELEIAEARQGALSRLKELQPRAADLKEAEQYRRPLTAIALVEDLAEEYGEIQKELTKAREAVELRRGELERTKGKLDAFGPVQDTTELQRLVKEIQAKGNLEEQYKDQLLALEEQEQLLQGQLSRLALWGGTLPELAQAKLPPAAIVESFHQEYQELKAERDALGKEIRQLEEEISGYQLQIKLQQTRGAVPAEEDLLNARERRDYGWQLVRRAWLEGQPDREKEKEFSPDQPLAEAYEASVKSGGPHRGRTAAGSGPGGPAAEPGSKAGKRRPDPPEQAAGPAGAAGPGRGLRAALAGDLGWPCAGVSAPCRDETVAGRGCKAS